MYDGFPVDVGPEPVEAESLAWLVRQIGDASLFEPPKGPDLSRLHRLLAVRDVLGDLESKVKDAIALHEDALARHAKAHDLETFGDENLSVTYRRVTHYSVRDWDEIPAIFRHRRLTETEVEKAVNDPDHPMHSRVHELLAEGALESQEYDKVNVRRKPGRARVA